MYEFFLEEVLLPVAPEKLTLKTANQNETMQLISGREINIAKLPGLSEFNFDALLPAVRYPFAVYPDGFHTPDYYLGVLEKFKLEKKPFYFKVNRRLPDGQLSFDTNMRVLLEDYSVTEEAKNGFDVTVSVNLKQAPEYGLQTVTVVENTVSGIPALQVETQRPAKSPEKTWVAGPLDTLWTICRKALGDGSRYGEIAQLNGIDNPNEIVPGQVIRLA